MTALLLAALVLVVGLMQLAAARDVRLWQSRAVESFRYLAAFGWIMLGLRLFWIQFYGDEPGIHFIARCSFLSMGLGHLGLIMNALSPRTIHVPKFLRKSLE